MRNVRSSWHVLSFKYVQQSQKNTEGRKSTFCAKMPCQAQVPPALAHK